MDKIDYRTPPNYPTPPGIDALRGRPETTDRLHGTLSGVLHRLRQMNEQLLDLNNTSCASSRALSGDTGGAQPPPANGGSSRVGDPSLIELLNDEISIACNHINATASSMHVVRKSIGID